MRALFDDPVVLPTRVGLLWCSVGEYRHPELDEPRERLGEWDTNDDTDTSLAHAETVWYMTKSLTYVTWPEPNDAVAVFDTRHVSIDNIVHTGVLDDGGLAVWLGHILGQDYRWWEHRDWEVTRIHRVEHPGHMAQAVMFGNPFGDS
jgi:hypothetical protein